LDFFGVADPCAPPSAPHRDPMEIYGNHAAILDAVLSGDPEQARDAVRRHYVGLEERITDSLA
jgi:DNA-binding FadR family transcriptional regulator